MAISRQRPITRHSADLLLQLSEELFIMEIQYIHIEYDFLLFMLKIETSTGGTNSIPFLVFRRDHLRSTSGIICCSGSFAVQFEDHFRSGDHLGRCTGLWFSSNPPRICNLFLSIRQSLSPPSPPSPP